MLADSEPKEECYHSLNWITAGKANQMEGGVKQASSPCVGMYESEVYHPDTKCSYLLRGTYTNYEGMALYPPKQPNKNDSQDRNNRSMRIMLLQ